VGGDRAESSMAQRAKLDAGINIKGSASRRRSQTRDFHWKTKGNRQGFQVSVRKWEDAKQQ